MYELQTTSQPFRNRTEAGTALASAVSSAGLVDPIVLALPRGGVPVAAEVAKALAAPLDLLIVRKVGAPEHPELGVGAVAEGGVKLLDTGVIGRLGIPQLAVDGAVAQAEAELDHQIQRFRGDHRRSPEIRGRDVVIVDDGLATGGTAAAAVMAARQMGAERVVVAVPVGAAEACQALSAVADSVVCLLSPSPMRAVGHWYDDFGQIADAEVIAILERRSSTTAQTPVTIRPQPVQIPAGEGVVLEADLTVFAEVTGLVIFAHGSGSSRLSPRNRHVAELLQRAGFGTLLADLLTVDEEDDRRSVFDIAMLATRLAACTRWAGSDPRTMGLPQGYFGASTGAAAALVAAASMPQVGAVVSRGGRPDLAGMALARVRAPVLLIVGSADPEVLALNRRAQHELGGAVDLSVVPGATHLFEEPGALDIVAAEAADWFERHLSIGGLTA